MTFISSSKVKKNVYFMSAEGMSLNEIYIFHFTR